MRCVAEVGYSRATIREIARAAHMTSGSLYHHFPNKAELVRATFDEVATIAVPRLTQAAERNVSTLEKLIGVLDESVRVMQDYPLAVAFDRAIRAESPRKLHLAEDSDLRFMALRRLIRTILEDGSRAEELAPGIGRSSAADAIFLILRGLNEYAASTPAATDYDATVAGLKRLLRGQLFT